MRRIVILVVVAVLFFTNCKKEKKSLGNNALASEGIPPKEINGAVNLSRHYSIISNTMSLYY